MGASVYSNALENWHHLLKMNLQQPCNSAIPFKSTYPIDISVPHGMYQNVHSSIICKNPKLKKNSKCLSRVQWICLYGILPQ